MCVHVKRLFSPEKKLLSNQAGMKNNHDGREYGGGTRSMAIRGQKRFNDIASGEEEESTQSVLEEPKKVEAVFTTRLERMWPLAIIVRLHFMLKPNKQ